METCRILLNHQANPEISLRIYGTPLSVAIRERKKELSCLLVQNCDEQPSRSLASTRADVYNALWPTGSYRDEDGPEDEYQYADEIFRGISDKEHGDFIKEVLGPTSTPLHDACARGNTKVASFLIRKAGFDVNREDDEGRTPLFLAVQEKQHDMIGWLFQNNQVRYLSKYDWSQLPENTAVKDTYRQVVEMCWCGTLCLPSLQPQEDPNIEYRQWALQAFEDSQYCIELGVEWNPFSFLPAMFDNYEESNAKRRRIDSGG